MLKRLGFVKFLSGFIIAVCIFMLGLTSALMWNSNKALSTVFGNTELTIDELTLTSSILKALALAHSNAMNAAAEPDADTRGIRMELADGFVKEFKNLVTKCGDKCNAVASPLHKYDESWQAWKKATTAANKPVATEGINAASEEGFEKLDKFMNERGKYATDELGIIKKSEDRKAQIFAIVGLALVLTFGITGFFFQRSVSTALDKVADAITQNISEAELTVQQLHEQSQTLNGLSERQMSAIHSTSSAVDEINSMADSVTKSALGSDELSKATQAAAEAGGQDLSDLSQSIEDIKTGNDNIAEKVQNNSKELFEIVKLISEIKDKTRVINDIVFQTRLLSFNASVESARAGEAGKGFAVVAEEVGRLATMSGGAAKEITSLLEVSAGRVKTIVEKTTAEISTLIREGQSRIEAGNSKAQHSKGSFERITNSMSELRSQIQQVTVAVQEQTEGLEDIGRATKDINLVGQESLNSTQLISGQASKLREQTELLRETNYNLANLIRGVEKLQVPPAKVVRKSENDDFFKGGSSAA